MDAATSDALLVTAGPQERLAEAVKSTVCAMRGAHGYGSGEEGTDLQVGGGRWEAQGRLRRNSALSIVQQGGSSGFHSAGLLTWLLFPTHCCRSSAPCARAPPAPPPSTPCCKRCSTRRAPAKPSCCAMPRRRTPWRWQAPPPPATMPAAAVAAAVGLQVRQRIMRARCSEWGIESSSRWGKGGQYRHLAEMVARRFSRGTQLVQCNWQSVYPMDCCQPLGAAAVQGDPMLTLPPSLPWQVNNYDKDVFNGDQGTVRCLPGCTGACIPQHGCTGLALQL